MFNRYLSEDREAFEDLYRPVQEEQEIIEDVQETVKEEKVPQPEVEEKPKEAVNASKNLLGGKLDLKRMLKGINLGEFGLLPLLLLAFLILDVDDDEKLLVFALAIVLGI